MADNAEVVRRTEHWFVARGIPHFIDRYSATRDVFTRALPVLTLVFLFEVTGALNAEWVWWANVLAAAGGFGLLLAIWAGANRIQGQRSFARPKRVGPIELAAFVVGPGLVPVVFGGQGLQGGGVALANLVILGFIYGVTSYGLVPLVRWSAVKVLQQVSTVAGLLARALPLLLLLVVFSFLTTEVWEVAVLADRATFAAFTGLFTAIGIAFLLTRLPTEIRRIGDLEGADVHELCRGTPVAGLAAASLAEPPPLSVRQRGNVLLVMLVSQAIQILLVVVTIFAFFVVFGMLAVPPDLVASWTGRALADPVATLTLGGHAYVLTTELLRVAAFLAAFSGFYFAVYVITDATYREEFFDNIAGEVRQAMAVRAVYLGITRPAPTP